MVASTTIDLVVVVVNQALKGLNIDTGEIYNDIDINRIRNPA